MDNKYVEVFIWKELKSVSNLALLWHLILAIGGLFLLLFVVHNGFLPELDLSAALSLLASVSLVGLALTISLFMLTTFGGLVMYFLFKETEAKLRGIITALAVFLATTGVYTLIVVIADNVPSEVQIVTFSSLSIVILVCACALIVHYRNTHNYLKQNRINPWGIFAVAVLVGLMYSGYQALIFLKIYQEPIQATSEWYQWLTFGVWLFFQALCMGLVASRSTPKAIFKMIVALGSISVILLIPLSNNPAFLINRMGQILGIGAVPNVRLVVNHTGCEILNVASKGILCHPNPNQLIYLAEPATLLSRIGKQMKIELKQDNCSTPTKKREKNRYTIVIPSIEVLGWREDDHTKVAESPKKNSCN